jgi:hypothetical protein
MVSAISWSPEFKTGRLCVSSQIQQATNYCDHSLPISIWCYCVPSWQISVNSTNGGCMIWQNSTSTGTKDGAIYSHSSLRITPCQFRYECMNNSTNPWIYFPSLRYTSFSEWNNLDKNWNPSRKKWSSRVSKFRKVGIHGVERCLKISLNQ